MQSPLLLPLTLITAGVLAFMAITGILPPALFRLWPVIFVILGVVGLLSISSEDMLEPASSSKKKSARKSKKSTKSKSRSTTKSKNSRNNKKTTKKTASRQSKNQTRRSTSKKK